MKAKRNLLALLLSVVMLWQGFSVVNAEDASTASGSTVSLSSSAVGGESRAAAKEIPDAVRSVEMTLDNKPVDANTKIYYFSQFALKVKLALSGKVVNEGDYTVIQLPDALEAANNEDVAITNDDGLVMANAHFDRGTKRITIKYTKNAENYSGSDGSFTFLVQIDRSVVQTKQRVPVNITINGQVVASVDMDYQGVTKDAEPSFWKNHGGKIETYEDADGLTHYLLHFYIQVNGRKLTTDGVVSEKYTNIKLYDKLISEVFNYVDPSDPTRSMNWKNASDADKFYPRLVRGVWRSGYRDSNYVFHTAVDDTEANRGPKWALMNPLDNNQPAGGKRVTLNYASDKRSFDYTVGDMGLGEGIELQYFVEIGEVPQDGTTYYNDASITGDSISMGTHHREFAVQKAGGTLNGKGFTLRIKKENEDGQPLSGAKFTIENKRTQIKKEVTTGVNGIAELKNVVREEYVIKEIKAPDGYVLDKNEQYITKEELKTSIADGATVTKVFVNQKEGEDKPASGNIVIQKKWILGGASVQKPNKVKVYLVENGVKNENKVQELSEENHWTASFSNLPKKDAAGAEIQYTVAEENLSDFTPAISGTEDTGFTITNYTGDRVAIPVTKIWKGSGEHPQGLTVQLYADSVRVASYYLTAQNGWQHTFDMPKYDDAGKEIKYTVTEENLSGYTASRADEEGNGYKNVFVNTKENPNTPGGGGNTPNTPGGGGNRPNTPGGGGNTPGTPSGNTPRNPSNPPSNTPEEPGSVLGADRPSVGDQTVNTDRKGDVLGESRPEVKGSGRGATKTADESAMKLYGILFALSVFSLGGLSFKNFLFKKREF